MYIYIKESKIPFIFSTFDINTNMAKHNTNFGKDLKNLSDLAFSVLNENTNEVINGGAAYKGGDVEHDWASHIKAPPFGESIKKILHHNLTEEGIVEEYYVEHNGKLVGLLAEDVEVVMYEAHGDEEEKSDKEDEEKEEEDKDEDEETLSESKSPKHGSRPKLIGVPILK